MILEKKKKLRKKDKDRKYSSSQEDLKDFIEGEDLDYGYEDEPQQPQVVIQSNNRLITDFVGNLNIGKAVVEQSAKQIESLFEFADIEQVEDDPENQDSTAFLNRANQEKQKKAMVVEDEFMKRRKADLEMLNLIAMDDQQEHIVSNGNSDLRKKTLADFDAKQPVYSNLNEQPVIQKKYFKDLKQQELVFLTDIYPYNNKLYLFCVMDDGHRLTIQVEEIERHLYFILKEREPTREAELQIKQKLFHAGIKDFRAEFVKMKYVFEIDGIPRGDVLTYLVRYPFSKEIKQQPKPDWEGSNYKYIVGTTYTPLEIFVIKNRIKGPGWIQIKKKYLQEGKNTAWTGLCINLMYPLSVQIPKDLDTIKVPQLRVLAFSLKWAKPREISKKRLFPENIKPDEAFIFCISIIFCENYNIEFKPKQPKYQQQLIYLKHMGRPTVGNHVKLSECQSQSQILGCFINYLSKYNPDFLCCHDSSSVLDMIITRLARSHNKEMFKLGRLSLGRMLNATNQKSKINMLLGGRLLVDSYAHAKDMLKSVDYELPSMSRLVPNIKPLAYVGTDEVKSMLENAQFTRLATHTLDQACCVFNLINHLEIIQITKQLTNICGNIWKRSLQNARAQRNQFLIMHECEKNSLLIPDKFIKEKDTEEQDEGKDKKKKYEGGLVLQPKKGLYTEFIFLLDFNSLYPSIIRQYNVCFSKIKRPAVPLSVYYKTKDNKKPKAEETQPEEFKVVVPEKEECTKQKWGFLPQLIHRIVEKRKVYKKLMKEATQQKYMVYDIVQKAYKLVANSIYGCLGFSNSRFYAKDLAALITQQGRKALIRGQEIANKQGAEVIYGDTDSLMIKVAQPADASEIEKVIHLNKRAQQLRKQINQQYRMLEMDIDGVFKPILLLMKKKYVAKKLSNFDEVRFKRVEPKYEIEYKGIQVVRRDGCEIARRTSKVILDVLLNNMTNIDQVITKIYQSLAQLNKGFSKMVPERDYNDFLLAKQLNKHPDEYKQGSERMPHIKVARDRIHQGEKAENLVNHAIYYLICKPRGENQTGNTLADNAYDEKTFLRSQKTSLKLEIDIDYYKAEQITPPIIRLLANIPEFKVQYMNSPEVFEITEKYKKNLKKLADEQNEVQVQEEELTLNFKKQDVDYVINKALFKIKCPNPACIELLDVVRKGMIRTVCTCGKNLVGIVSNKLQNYIHLQCQEFYMLKYKCSKCKKVSKLKKIKCCGQTPIKQHNISEMHNILYSFKKAIDYSEYETQKIVKKDNSKSLYSGFSKLIDQFLKRSKFQKLPSGLMSRLK